MSGRDNCKKEEKAMRKMSTLGITFLFAPAN